MALVETRNDENNFTTMTEQEAQQSQTYRPTLYVM